MSVSRSSTWLVSACLLALAAAMLGGLLLGVAGDRKGMHALPDASGSVVDVLADRRAALTFADVRAKPEDEWRRWEGRGYIQAFFGEAVWVRITLRNPTAEAQRGVLADAEYYTDHVDLWVEEEAGWNALSLTRFSGADTNQRLGGKSLHPSSDWRHERAGEWVPAAEKSMWGRDAAFLLAVPAGSERTVYLRLQDYFGVWLRPVWWPQARTFFSAQLRDAFAEASYFGILLALFVYNGVVWARLRFRDIGWYLGYLGSAAVFMFMARAQHQVVGWAAGSPVLLVAAIAAWRAGSYHARFFVLSFGLLLAGVLPTAVIWLRAIPLGLSAMAMMLGSALEMLLLSLAITDRFARLQQDKIAAQALAVAEAEQRRAMQEAYADELEHEVRERTGELAAANAAKDRMIAVLGHDLRSPLTALTLSAEQVATDAAAAAARPRFAEETAQTGRALLLLLEDVVLWVRLRAGAGRAADHPADNLAAPAVELHRAGAERNGVALRLAVAPGLRVRADLVLAQTLVRNLTSNAVKSARSRVTVAVAAAPDGRVRVSVSDDGPGLPPGLAARLRAAGPADSTHPWSARSGLGLRLCQEIVQAMGTQLEVTEPPGGGAEISFTLPGGEN
ncbi:MAG: sensor histidine kinase [Opitutae bacterium]|nr:sensor histidine kinase [Opitutae bacterium]